MARTKFIWLSLAIGALVLASGMLFPSVSEWVLWPGVVLTVPFWPQGIHSNFSSTAGIAAMLAVVWVGSWVAWSALAFLAFRVWGRVAA
jgi:hypothetical protein